MSDELTKLFACIPYSKNPETIEEEYDREIDGVYEELRKSNFEREEDVVYDQNGQLTRVDIWGPQKTDKLLIMFHGGYWLFGSRKKCLSIVKTAKSVGYTVASIGYDFANKQHPLSRTVEESMNGLDFVLNRFKTCQKVVIAGHSVGAHLAFQTITRPNLDGRIKGAFLIAGLYQLEEFAHTDYGRDLGLTPSEAKKFSCNLELLNHITFPILVTCGKLEAPKLYQQNLEFSKYRVDLKIYPNEDHFSVLTDLQTNGTVIFEDFKNFLSKI